MIGRTVGPYRIDAPLGEGGIGAVFRAVDTLLDRPVAIKVLRPELGHDGRFIERFRGEAASLARLNHPNITTLYTLHVEAGQLMMIIELIEGRTLEDLLALRGRVGADECRAIAAQATDGFAYAHRMGIVHRDIKPANLMLTADGQLKIMDFGIARIRGSQRMTRTGHMIGTLAYMAPEQILGQEGDERSDVYSLGIVLYEVLAGRPPFAADSEYMLIRAQMEELPERLQARLPAVDPALERAVMQALAKSPDERHPDMPAFARALGALINPSEARATLAARIGAGIAGLKATRAAPAIDLAAYGLASASARRPQPAAGLADAGSAPPALAAASIQVAPPVLPPAATPLTGPAAAAVATPAPPSPRRLPLPALLLALAAAAVAGFVGLVLMRTPAAPPPVAQPAPPPTSAPAAPPVASPVAPAAAPPALARPLPPPEPPLQQPPPPPSIAQPPASPPTLAPEVPAAVGAAAGLLLPRREASPPPAPEQAKPQRKQERATPPPAAKRQPAAGGETRRRPSTSEPARSQPPAGGGSGGSGSGGSGSGGSGGGGGSSGGSGGWKIIR